MRKRYRPDIEASKAICFRLIQNKKSKVIPDKKKFNKKKERRKSKLLLKKETYLNF